MAKTAKQIALELASDDLASLLLTEGPENVETDEASADEIRKEINALCNELYSRSLKEQIVMISANGLYLGSLEDSECVKTVEVYPKG